MNGLNLHLLKSAALVLGLASFAGTAAAGPISVPNFSFENPVQSGGSNSQGGGNGNSNSAIANWDIFTPNVNAGGGVQDVTTTEYPAGVPNGHQFAFANVQQPGYTVTLRLTPSTNTLPTIAGGDVYTLTVALGNR
jgi:hypothetical protein